MSRCPYGFWVRGGAFEPRVLVDARRAFAGFAACSEAARLDAEHYLSPFTFGADFRNYLDTTGSTAKFDGVCGADWVWWDLDRGDDIDAALADARALWIHMEDACGVRPEDSLAFVSGMKGFHLGLPTSLWAPEPSALFNRVSREFALRIARSAGSGGVAIDAGVFDKQRLFRAPNSRHPRTGLRKRMLTPKELLGLSIERIAELAREPRPFDVPGADGRNSSLAEAWASASAEVAAQDTAMRARAAAVCAAGGPTRLNELTLEFIREGAPEGGPGAPPEAGRHRRLYAAARNLGEFDCPALLAQALLSEPALDCGITPGEVRRNIENGLRDSARKETTDG